MAYLRAYQMQGDPGLFGALGGAIKGFFRGGPVGAITGGISGFGSSTSRAPAMPRGRMQITPRNFAPGGAPLVQRGTVVPSGGLPPRGYRLNKTDYFLKDGTFVPKGTRYVKTRSRNPANSRALRRALSRVESFGGLVKRARKTTKKLKSL